MVAPQSLMAPSAQEQVAALIAGSPLAQKYAEVADRESAYEKLQTRMAAAPTPAEEPAPAPKTAPRPAPAAKRQPKEQPGVVEQVVQSSAFRSMMRSAGTVIGREITRSIFGTARRGRR
jgi:hypothetical protein